MGPVDTLCRLDRISALDAAFLALERDPTPMHIGSIAYLDPGPLRDRNGRIRLAELRTLVAERLALAPRFRQLPRAAPLGLGRPVWVDDQDFDVADHVNEIVLPAPGTDGQIAELCSHLMMKVLERSRPLWELWVVDGAADGSVVLIEKVHHVMMDGVSGIGIALLLTDPTPQVDRTERAPQPVSAPPSTGTLLAAGLLDAVTVPLSLGRLGAEVGLDLLRSAWDRSERAHLRSQALALGRGIGSLLRPSTVAPRSPLNRPVGQHRSYAHVEVPLEAVRQVARAAGATLNDVALGAVAGGVRQLFLARDEGLGRRFQVAVPVSTRRATEHASLGNRLSVFLVPLPVGIADPVAQLGEVKQMTGRRKAVGQAKTVAGLVDAADRLPLPLVQAAARLGHRQPFANAVVTNVPGPPEERYLLGARIRRIAPVVPLAANLDLSVGIVSYDQELSFGCFADAERCPDLDRLTEGIRASVEALGRAFAIQGGAP